MKTITFTLTVSDEALDCNEFAGGNHRRRKRRRSTEPATSAFVVKP